MSKDLYRQGNNHGNASIVMHICHLANQGRDTATSNDTSHNESATTLVVTSEATDSESNDCREAYGLEEQRYEKHC